MIINHSHKFVFVHVPKTAGTSVSNMLSGLTTYRDLEIGVGQLGQALQATYGRRFGLTKHAYAHRIRQVMGEGDWSEYFSFGFARNPFARLLSVYHFLKSWDKLPEAEAREMARFETFEEFLEGDTWIKDGGPSGIYQPQSTWLTAKDDPQKLIVDFVGRQETLAKDMERIAQRIGDGVFFDTSQMANKTPSYRKAVDWTPATIERVVARYRTDFDLLDYPKTPE